MPNAMQNDRFHFQTVANTRQMEPGKKAKKKTKPEAKTNTNYSTFSIRAPRIYSMGRGITFSL